MRPDCKKFENHWSSSMEDSEYEPFLRSLNTSDNSASSSDNDYFSTSEEEGGEGRAWRSLELSEERMNAPPPPRFPLTLYCPRGHFRPLIKKLN